MNPAERSMKHLRAAGYTVQKVERWQSFFGGRKGGVRIDLFGCIDLLAIRPGEIVGVQCGAGSGHSSHLKKIMAEPKAFLWLQAGGRLVIHSWRKLKPRGKREHWEVREETVDLLSDWTFKEEPIEQAEDSSDKGL